MVETNKSLYEKSDELWNTWLLVEESVCPSAETKRADSFTEVRKDFDKNYYNGRR